MNIPMDKMLTDLYNIPFDQYQRYKHIADIIEQIRVKGKRFKILEIGSYYDMNLAKFLPEDEIYYLEPRFLNFYKQYQKKYLIAGDGACAPFYSNAFDIVVSVDVFEHVEKKRRPLFLQEMIRLSSICGILGAPFDNNDVSNHEVILNEFYKIKNNIDHPWLKEHIDNGLPNLNQTLDLLNKEYLFSYIFDNGYLRRWSKMMRICFFVSQNTEFIPFYEKINIFYNKNFFNYDIKGPSYRKILVFSDSQLKIEAKIKDEDSCLIEKEKILDELIKDIYQLAKNEKIKKLYEQIQAKDTHIQNLEAVVQAKDTHIQNLEAVVQNLETAINFIKQTKIWRASEFFKKIIYQKILGKTPLLQRSLVTISSEGLGPFINKVKNNLRISRVKALTGIGKTDYDIWMDINQLTKKKIQNIESKIALFQYKPKISIIMPVYNVDKKWLIKAIESVINQLYNNWELCIADDGSTQKHIPEVLDAFSKKDKRIKIKYIQNNMGISKASNEALSLATGEFAGMLDHDDELAMDALYEVVKLLNENKEIDFIYSDEDKITQKLKRKDPFFKPDWSPDMLRSYNYICHFTVLKKTIIDAAGGFRKGYEGAQDYDLFLRCSELTQKIAHIPKILYHWRIIDGSAAQDSDAKKYAFESAKKALADHIQRTGFNGMVQDGLLLGSYRIHYQINHDTDVTILIPTKDKIEILKRCIDSILQKSTYKKYSILVVDNASIEEKTFLYYEELKKHRNISILKYDMPFNFSAINNYAVDRVDSEYIVFLNNDTEVISPGWIESMLEFVQRRDVGAAGGLLYYPDNTVQHGGVILGIGGVAGHAHKYLSKQSFGMMGRLKVPQNFSAVTAACMMVKKTVFQEAGGFDETYSYAFNDVDLCLKIREKGYLIVYTPYTELYHHESISRGCEDTEEKVKRFNSEIDRFQKKWKDLLAKGDPYYNPNLTLDKEDFSLKL